MIKKKLIFIIFPLFIFSCSAEKNFQQELQTLISAEQSFAALSKKSGMREAFLTYLTEDAIVFRPRPENGHTAYKNSPTQPGMLQWKPVHSAISHDCDLGFNTGPWEWRPTGKEEKPTLFGHFVSLWRKDSEANWRVIFDAGVGYATPSPEHNIDTVFKEFPRAKPEPAIASAIVNLEEKFSENIASIGYAEALKRFATEKTRFYHKQDFPVIGAEVLLETIAEDERNWFFDPITSDIATSNDLGYAYGYISNAGKSEIYSYLHIYRKNAANQWHLAVDLINRIPQEKTD